MDFIHEPQRFVFEMEDKEKRQVVKGEIIGPSKVEGFDDLKLNAVIALLNSVDQEHFQAQGAIDMFDGYIREIEDTLEAMKKYSRFQGQIKS